MSVQLKLRQFHLLQTKYLNDIHRGNCPTFERMNFRSIMNIFSEKNNKANNLKLGEKSYIFTHFRKLDKNGIIFL